MRPTFLAILVLLGACGPAQSEFSAEYTRGWCNHYLECVDPAILVFDGIETFEDCEALAAPEVVAMGSGCKFKAGKVDECLASLEALTCQAEGEPFEFVVPAACEEVYPGCDLSISIQGEQDVGGETEEPPEDTDGDVEG